MTPRSFRCWRRQSDPLSNVRGFFENSWQFLSSHPLTRKHKPSGGRGRWGTLFRSAARSFLKESQDGAAKRPSRNHSDDYDRHPGQDFAQPRTDHKPEQAQIGYEAGDENKLSRAHKHRAALITFFALAQAAFGR